MKLTDRSFDGQKLENGTYRFRIDNPKYDGEQNNVSIRATVVGGEFDGQWIVDYYNLGRKNGDARPNFGVTKLSVLLNAIGLEPDNDFDDREAMDEYILSMEGRFAESAKMPSLVSSIDGRMFEGTVKQNDKYTNIVKYAPIVQGDTASEPVGKPSWK